MSIIGKGRKQAKPNLPSLFENGWEKATDGTVSPKKCLELPAPQAVIKLVKCVCKKKQCSRSCACKKNNLACTAICKCSDHGSSVDYHTASEDDCD